MQPPVISTNVGGLPELIEDGKSGYLCDVGDVDSMVSKAIHILDESNLNRFKRAALSRAKSFDFNVILPQYEQIYKRVLEKSLKTV